MLPHFAMIRAWPENRSGTKPLPVSIMDAIRILSIGEVQQVLQDLQRRSKRSVSSRLNKTLFRLSCCCGLRRKEIAGLNCGDIVVDGSRPIVHIRKDNTKGRAGERRARNVPLWWDKGTLDDITAWLEFRRLSGGTDNDPFLCQLQVGHFGERQSEEAVALRWRTCLRILGKARRNQLSIHCGRHSFVSHCLHAGRTLVEVRDAAGHRNIATTSIYSHLLEQDGVADVFGSPQ
jgi:site-specific recombinase XerC